ncbi:MAG: DUF4411 family protein [Haliscomenobacteraceae bacterium CHB4]|nr:hypothetical protein [Saprospiraceae bacterium]MCE7925057.1 DUF4411 family protein [Haliscomenobacteraceae bacterium CHB4]
MKLAIEKTYCLDTSFLIHLDAYYPRKSSIFLPVWEDLESLVRSGLLKTMELMEKEVQSYVGTHGFLKSWVESFSTQLIEPMTAEIFNGAQRVIREHPEVLDPKKQLAGKDEADPFLIALAMVNGAFLLTQESKTNPNKIPTVAAYYNVQTMSIIDFLGERGFKLVKS